MRVIAVRAEPASALPGESVELSLLHPDLLTEDWSPEPGGLQIVWFGGCHNPPSGQYYGCLSALGAKVEGFPQTVAELMSGRQRGDIGLGPTFSLQVPDDVLIETSAGVQGVSYAFFVACRGELREDRTSDHVIPVGCFDGKGRPRGAQDFVIGYATVYSYPERRNHNPALETVQLGGVPYDPQTPCADDADCDPLAREGQPFGCGAAGTCLPILTPCPRGSSTTCESLRITAAIDPDSAERMTPGATRRETLRLQVHTPLSSSDDVIVYQDGRGFDESPIQAVLPPVEDLRRSGMDEEVPFVLVARDNRGGHSWFRWTVLVRDGS